MENFIEHALTVTVSVMASSGFWAYFSKRSERKSAINQLILGMAHDRVVYMGMKYVQRGWIYKDEYDDYMRYLYNPYSKLGGNGLADKVVKEVNELSFRHREEIGTIYAPKA